MNRKTLFWQFLPPVLVISLVSLALTCWYSYRALKDIYEQRAREDLLARLRLAEDSFSQRLNDEPALLRMCREEGRRTQTRLTVIRADGKVLADSDEDPERMENHGQRPEVLAALSGEVGTDQRVSATTHEETLYTAVPLRKETKITHVLRFAFTTETLNRAVAGALAYELALGAAIAVLLALGVSYLVSRWMARYLEQMRGSAERIARGEFETRCPRPDNVELAGLAEALNAMAVQLQDRIQSLQRQRNELEAVLGSMVEGVLAVDTEERLLSLNAAAARLLGVSAEESVGRTIQEAVRHADLQKFIQRTLASNTPIESEIILAGHEETYLQAHGTLLKGAQGMRIGALVVVNDHTRVRRLENMRRDFVANVSHELKTPITSIRGFVETLADGAMKDPQDAERFLQIIARQADRLNAIIEDLLTLARIEQGEEKDSIALQEGPVREVLQAAIQACEVKANAKNVAITLACDPELALNINGPLLEQAVVNLIDNAIKYSESGSKVHVEAQRENVQNGTHAQISVRDWGSGIPKDHQARIFERFYRVDKARSRSLGGTGLGLAIVKHIAQAHGGRVSVESAPGKGATFTLFL